MSDNNGNSSNGSFNVTIEDTTAPILTVPETITVEAENILGTAVTYVITATDIVDMDPNINCMPASGAIFSLGTTMVNCIAVDNSGNNMNNNFNVTVMDTIAPVLTIPESITVEAESIDGTVVTYVVTATDSVDPNPIINCTPASGEVFPLGVTAVNCTATDSSSNSGNNHSFFVIVTERESYHIYLPLIVRP